MLCGMWLLLDCLNAVQAKPDLQVESAGLCRALFETYLGDSSVVPDAKATWAQTVQQLLQDDKAARAEKGGAG